MRCLITGFAELVFRKKAKYTLIPATGKGEEVTMILDIGCGTRPKGDVNIDFCRNDLNAQNGAQSSGELISKKPDNFIMADAMHLPFRDESFSVVFSNHTIEHVKNPIKMLREMCRVSKRKIVVRCLHRKGTGTLRSPHLNNLDEEFFQQASGVLGLKSLSFVRLFDNPFSGKFELCFPKKLGPLIAKTFAWRFLKRLERAIVRRGILAFPIELEVWINKNQQPSNCDKLVFVVCYNIPEIYKKCFLSSPYTSEAKIEAKNNREAKNEALPSVFNCIVNKYISEDVWLAFCHQDLILNEDLRKKLKDKVPGIYGVIGASYGDYTLRGQIIQTNERPIGKHLENICPVQTLDEMCIIVHSSLFRDGLEFDERFDFHFYGADLCMQAYTRGFDVYAMQVNCQHRSRTLTGDLESAEYVKGVELFREKWGKDLPVRTTTRVVEA